MPNNKTDNNGSEPTVVKCKSIELNNPVVLKIYGTTTIVETKKDGIITTDTVSTDSLLKSFVKNEQTYTSPLLPREVIKYSTTSDDVHLLTYHEERENVTLLKREKNNVLTYENCYIPKILLKISLKSCEDNGNKYYRIAKVKAYGTKTPYELLSDITQLYEIPLPNIYQDCSICFGGNQSVLSSLKYTNLTAMPEYIYNLIFNSEFNQDLSDNAVDLNRLKDKDFVCSGEIYTKQKSTIGKVI